MNGLAQHKQILVPVIASLTLGLVGCSDGDDDDPIAPPPGAQAAKLTLLFTSDGHSKLFAGSPELDDYPAATAAGDGSLSGGLARRAALLKAERERASGLGHDTLTVSAGDIVMGALPHVTFEDAGLDYQLLDALGYDLVTLGNHEFDFGPDVLASAIGAANSAGAIPGIVTSNIHFDSGSGDDSLEALYSDDPTDSAPMHPYQVLTTPGGIKVGFIGLVGADAAYVAPNKAPVLFSGAAEDEGDTEVVLPLIYADLQPVVDTLRNEEGVDIVVALSHTGLGDDPSAIESAEDYQICDNVTGLDLIISGHSHNHDAAPVEVSRSDGSSCLVLNGGGYGKYLGRVELEVTPGAGVAATWDGATQTLLDIDDQIVPDPDFAAELDGFVATIEAWGPGGGDSYLEALASLVEGSAVSDDTGTAGDLYFRTVGHTDFDVTEEAMLNYLSADAMLAATDELSLHTDMGLESAGVVRMGLYQGKTGDIALTDAFNVVPLGNSPIDGSMGYALLRAWVRAYEVRAVFEFSATQGPANNNFRLGASGVRVTYDKTRPPVESSMDLVDDSKGWVMKIEVDSDHADGYEQFDTVIYDRDQGYESPDDVSVVTSTYIAEFAGAAGVSLKDENGSATTIVDSILLRGDTSEYKQVEAFMTFLKMAPGGTLPDLYDVSSGSKTVRVICTAGCD